MTRDEPSTLPSAEEPADGVPRMVPGHKWIRALVDGQVVVDARAFTFVWEIPYWPTWFFRPEDLNSELRETHGAARQRLRRDDAYVPVGPPACRAWMHRIASRRPAPLRRPL
jgi:uncharacterized protein (DUF427 family)